MQVWRCKYWRMLISSDGSGRTGTLILLDAMIDMAESEVRVDFLGFLFKMRLCRANLVETLVKALEYYIDDEKMRQHIVQFLVFFYA